MLPVVIRRPSREEVAMASTSHERIARQVLEAWNTHDVERVVACYTPASRLSGSRNARLRAGRRCAPAIPDQDVRVLANALVGSRGLPSGGDERRCLPLAS